MPSARSPRQATQQRLVDEGRRLPGVAEILDTYGNLAPYTQTVYGAQPAQVKNATGGNR